jgi:hypothetical protein
MLSAKHVDDVLAGFNDRQIATYGTSKGAAEFNAMIAQGRKHGVAFELLLGDPSWISPSGEASLEAILRRLRRLQFAGLNLDLEPNEVQGQPIRTVLAHLVTVMRAYVRASPWAVTLDVNFIYMDGRFHKTHGYCLACELERVGLRRIDLMTYIGNPRAVATIDLPMLKSYPSIQFRIAQSVEPPPILPPYDSYWQDGFSRFYADMRELDRRMSARPNYAGIVVESLQYLESIKPRELSRGSKRLTGAEARRG